MKENSTTTLPRRQFLQAISAGLLLSLIPASSSAQEGGAITKSVFRLRGRAWVNGKAVDLRQRATRTKYQSSGKFARVKPYG